MKKIEIEYESMGIRKTRRFSAPQHWNELTPSQFLVACSYLTGIYQYEEAVNKIMALDPDIVDRLDSICEYELYSLLEWMNDLPIRFNTFPLSSLHGLKSPEPMLAGMSLQQFMTADTYFLLYISSEPKNTEYLDQFIASLYLHPSESYFPTKKQSELDLDARTAFVSEKFTDEEKAALFINFLFIKKWLSVSYEFFFASTPTKSKTIELGPSSAIPVDWLAVFDSFVGDNVAQIEKYKRMDCMDAFRIINRKIKSSRK